MLKRNGPNDMTSRICADLQDIAPLLLFHQQITILGEGRITRYRMTLLITQSPRIRMAAHNRRDHGHPIVALCPRAKAPRPRHAGSADESGGNIVVSERFRPRRVFDSAPKWTRPGSRRPNWPQRGPIRCTEARLAN
jgi:hypothetical protein